MGVAPRVHGLVWGLDHGGTMRIEGHIMDKCTLLERQVSTEEKHSIMRDMQQLLGRLHGQGILHGDVKLSNFVRDSDGALLLSDFETAAFISDSFVPSKSTARHTSPRRLQSPGLPLNMTDDIYALGIAVYHLFTNQLPFPEVEDEADADDKIRDATEPLDTSLIESAVVRGFVDRSLMVGKAVK